MRHPASLVSQPQHHSAWRVAPGGLVWAMRHRATPCVVAPYLDETGALRGRGDGAATVPEE
jgi:hypothetical protein